MNKLVIPLAAALIGIAAAIAGFNSLKSSHTSTLATGPMTVIGEVTEAKGDVQHRLPRSLQLEPVSTQAPFHAQEWLITGRDSEAVVVFVNSTALRLAGDTRIVAEQDPNSSDGLVVTVLSGDVSIASPGPADKLRVFRDGAEYKPARGAVVTKVPLIRSGGASSTAAATGTPSTAGAPDTSGTPASSVIATTPDEPAAAAATPATTIATTAKPPATPPRKLPPYHAPGTGTEDTLSDDEIARQLKSQTSFFQRCYLTFINRTKTATTNPQAAGPSGVVTVAFVIQPNGKTTGVKVVRSDLADSTLQKCVTEVVERTSFRAFNSDAIPVSEFPIELK